MDFAALIIFLSLYYLRPQEWFSEFNALHPVQLLSFIAVYAMFQARKLNPRDLVRTPLDWLILCYFLWTLFAGGEFMTTLGGIEAVLLFYFVAVRSLDSVPRQKTFLGWWCVFMLVIAALAIASEHGFDPLGTNDITQGPMKGRLMLNLSIFNNPNALAHSVVPAVPLIYYLLFWRRVAMKMWLIVLALPLYCIFLTQSKGAYLCGFATLLATLMFGRSRAWQLVILILAASVGYGALYALPRMNELKNSKTDPAIQGRVAALTFGLHLMQTDWWGIGLGNFQNTFFRYGPQEKHKITRVIPGRKVPDGADGQTRELDPEHIKVTVWNHYVKATHGAYNQNGAELGYVGLYLFVGILYCCIRTLVLMKCEDDDEERIRRALFATVVAYAVSSWMVDFCYRPTFFMFVAAISAFHRHLLRKHAEDPQPAVIDPAPQARRWLHPRPLVVPSLALPGLAATASAACMPATAVPLIPVSQQGVSMNGRHLNWHKSSLGDNLLKKFIWTRLGILDYLIILVLTYLTILYWKHLIATM
jgi:hypothetical protein